MLEIFDEIQELGKGATDKTKSAEEHMGTAAVIRKHVEASVTQKVSDAANKQDPQLEQVSEAVDANINEVKSSAEKNKTNVEGVVNKLAAKLEKTVEEVRDYRNFSCSEAKPYWKPNWDFVPVV